MASTLFKSSTSTPSKTVKFSEIFPMEEVTHFERNNSTVSILSQKEGGSVSTSVTGTGFDPSAPRSIFSSGSRNGRTGFVSKNPFVTDHGGESDSDDSDDSHIQVFNRAENYNVDIFNSATGHVQQEKIKSGATTTSNGGDAQNNSKFKGTESEENLFDSFGFLSFNDSFVLDVKRADVILDAIVLFVIVAELLIDISLISWYYRDGQTWAASMTALFFFAGIASILHQFNSLSQDQIKRLFDKGKTIRILVNCIPPLATILSAYQCVMIGYMARTEAMMCGRYLEIENFSKRLSKTQSFFQAAPQATLQLLLLTESIDSNSIGILKGFISMLSIIVSLTVMTNASLPSKAENHDHLRKTTQRPSSRIFVGIRMFSSFASRTMAVTSLLIGCRCLLGSDARAIGTIIAISIVLVPRVIFTFVEFVRLVVIGRRNRDAAKIHQPSCYEIFMGYIATILFPVGDPIWIFLYVWIESALFVIVGNIIGWSQSCLINAVNATYTAMFLILFIIIPILIPFARASIKQRQTTHGESTFQNGQSSNISNVQQISANLS